MERYRKVACLTYYGQGFVDGEICRVAFRAGGEVYGSLCQWIFRGSTVAITAADRALWVS